EKLNLYRGFQAGRHDVTVFGAAYYGFSRIPGLVPTAVNVPGDTIDPNQLDLTYTALAAASDTWTPSDHQTLQFGGFFRGYSLRLQSDFGDGLIRQSEERKVAGGESTYFYKFNSRFSILAGLTLRRDAPRNLDLERANQEGLFGPVTSNNVTIGFVSPYAAIDGLLTRFIQYNLGVRREEVFFNNNDVVTPANSFDIHQGITLPKATITLLPVHENVPAVAFSYGEAFHTNDPRIGSAGVGSARPTLIPLSRAYQLIATEVFHKTELGVTLARVRSQSELAKIDPDTGLQTDVGPSLVKSITVMARRQFHFGSLMASFARADAKDLLLGGDTPEAPRLIWDAVGTVDQLPFKLHSKFEFEYVGKKPLGDGFTATPVTEFRGALVRPFKEGRIDAGIYFLLASGFSGQTTEVLALPGESEPFERVVGVRLKSYASFSMKYHFRRGGSQ
ncbi:MAG TPA: hypothetical protein VLZ81_07905, partial [Blastocatellia bacterium]|nr:hypothetical protein [Blastocatellia bacterium]